MVSRKILNVVGARPNFMKIAPLMMACRAAGIEPLLVHTGQHHDQCMSGAFFDDLGIARPNVNLGISRGSPVQQTAAIMSALEPVLLEHRPDMLVVVGDVTSTMACALAAVKLGVRVAHVEAGLRSFDRTMPEEINRLVTDSVSDLLFCSEPSGVENLQREGITDGRVHLVGNVMIDTLLSYRDRAERSDVLERVSLQPREYALLTLHRPSNVDDPAVFPRLLDAVEQIQRDLPVIFPVHPRTARALAAPAIQRRTSAMPQLRITPPLGYLDFLKLTASARVVLTDSGGLQEETTILKVPCLTLRDNTERPITIECGWNRLVGTEPSAIVGAYRQIMSGQLPPPRVPPLWDGHAAERIVRILAGRL